MKKILLTDKNIHDLKKGDLIFLDTHLKTISTFLNLIKTRRGYDLFLFVHFVKLEKQSTGFSCYGFTPINKGNLYLLKYKGKNKNG